jgi:hypothetical protein
MSLARTLPGVHGVLTAKTSLAGGIGLVSTDWPIRSGLGAHSHVGDAPSWQRNAEIAAMFWTLLLMICSQPLVNDRLRRHP